MNIVEVIKHKGVSGHLSRIQWLKERLRQILEFAINAPSANNLQPWEFTVVMDKEKERLSRTLIKAYREKQLSCNSGAVKPLSQVIEQRGDTDEGITQTLC